MKYMDVLSKSAAGLAVISMLTPVSAFGAQPSLPRQASHVQQAVVNQVVTDVALTSDGVLRGNVMNASGAPLANTKVVIKKDGQLVGFWFSDQAGNFSAPGLNGGNYQMQTPDSSANFRVWSENAAPPSAYPYAQMGGPMVLGQGAGGGIFGFAANPWIIGAAVITAIVVPVAISASDDDKKNGS